MTSVSSKNSVETASGYLGIFTLLYTCVLVLTNWFDPRTIEIFGLDTPVGSLTFPMTYILSDVITEVYGYKNARRCIQLGLLINAFFIILGYVFTHMPSPSDPALASINEKFDSIFSFNALIVIASTCSYVIAEPLNSYVMAKMKSKKINCGSNEGMGYRFLASTMISAVFDCTVFCVIAYHNLLSFHEIVHFAASMWLIKVGIELCVLIFSIRIAIKLKKIEKTDIYDFDTDFSIWKINTLYRVKNNRYKNV